MKKQINSVHLVAQYLLDNKKSYIHDIKRKCKANNPMQRIKSLRDVFKWQIETKLEGYDGRIPIYYYKLKKAGKMPEKYNLLKNS
jgi:hypothetical protein